MTLSDLLDGAFRVIKARPRTVFGIAAAILVPVYLLGAFLQRDVLRSSSVFPTFGGGSLATFTPGALLGSAAARLIEAAALFLLGGALGRLISAWYAGGDLSATEALGAAMRRSPALLAAFALLLPLKVMGYLVEEVGALVPVTLFVVTAPVIVIEGLGPIAGAGRSWRLVARRFWWCVLVVLVATIGSTVLSLVLGVVPELLATLLPSPFNWIASGAAQAAVAMVVTTALTSLSVLLYLDLRIRTEGLDIELDAADAFAHAA
jgi:hypothetical protein